MKTFIVGLVLALASSVALAQPGDAHKGGGKGGRLLRMQDELGLTEEQVQKIREVHEAGGSRADIQAVLTSEQQSKAVELRKEHREKRGDRAERLQKHLDLSDEQVAEMRKIRQQGGSREEMRGVLTADQQVEFDKMAGRHKDKNAQGKSAQPAE